ncbi:MAG TPA: tRNA (adenosine(37)-N6)-threonylcarbamoyltransferase complex ATPase subunit type 1 TsaE [Alphaproteobacteria bacterium]|nr:tRNA (adenosine(37)-N6)-threonylcarbamoyltransferase complex ATPase subunit type 1 TsaE [Alphaproteobacteria bacterium]USO05273.1 MAG: tRNA (adenosine(37)-N6)-threonylcarbamoyltransferase complex ATPase subunit type 1 TsaE [Rhodospirillales bacterium]HOO80925.1 tRNA (adenosine(37)-N6)-threonylcarbamoyltransferase complex ATPase subunit type 1 TsaE [Alphaproteobacteria bacterium]
MKHISDNEKDTSRIAAALAEDLQPGNVLLLHGTLGMGKTVFARALIRALTNQHDIDVPSPTFTLVQLYDGLTCPIYHYDLYRIEHPDEIFELGWDDALADGITIVEWPDRLGPYKPPLSLDITLSNADNDPNKREILIEKNA